MTRQKWTSDGQIVEIDKRWTESWRRTRWTSDVRRGVRRDMKRDEKTETVSRDIIVVVFGAWLYSPIF